MRWVEAAEERAPAGAGHFTMRSISMSRMFRRAPGLIAGAMAVACAGLAGTTASAQEDLSPEMAAAASSKARSSGSKSKKDDLPKFEKVGEGYEKVVSTTDGANPLYTLYVREKDGQMLAELPRNLERQKLFIATTITGGIGANTHIQWGDTYAYWKKFGDRLALMQSELATRSTGDDESKISLDEQFTDRVILDVPIVAKGENGGYVIDMDDLLLGNARSFYGPLASGVNKRLATIAKAKAFPQNVEIAFTAPVAANQNRLTTFHYSISVLPERTGYKPREADYRVGFFVTAYNDLAKVPDDSTWTRYINRWNLEKADPKLSMSPPKEPIVFYISDTTPIRYRRYVREGILEWNKAFEKVGIVNAVEVYQQDARTGAHMDKDPEDRRYNFYVWNSNGAGFAIGPSRVDPRTGQIIDADVVMNDGWIRFAAAQWQRVLPQQAMENFGPETLAWLDQHPELDPRIRLLPSAERVEALRQRRLELAQGGRPFGGHPAASGDPRFIGDDPYDGLDGRISQINGYCAMADDRGMDLAMARLGLLPIMGKGNGEGDMLDGAPEWFVGAVIKDVTMHEIGHTLGLRHNFIASTIYTMDEINSAKMKGQAFTGSVMDYNAVNIQYGDLGTEQAAYFMPTIGPYDYWAIRYGYAQSDKELKDILAESTDPTHVYATDEDTFGPDPRARRRDMGKDALDFERSMMQLVQDLRKEIVDRVLEEGDSYQKVRDAYGTTLGIHFRAVSNAANWVGGTYLNRDRVGDADRNPNEPVDVDLQRQALEFVINNAFNDEAFGLTPELLAKMGLDKWWGSMPQSLLFADPPFEVHDTILGIQSVAMTMLLNPTTLKRVYDNEYRTPADDDAVTLPEVLFGVTDAAWSELDTRSDRRYTEREPMISSLRRNLQRENLDRLIDLTMPGALTGAAAKPVQTLAAFKLRELDEKIESALKRADSKIDAYTLAHLSDAHVRIGKALDAVYIYNADEIGSRGPSGGPFGRPVNR
ncbi:MAG: DUF5117 domain-containing protein [Planctomycetota bacterium]|nr:MAG: DUF5117 domain-containing protein [Planctomycetota bacterium]